MQGDEVGHLAHDYSIGYHEPSMEGCLLRDFRQSIDSSC